MEKHKDSKGNARWTIKNNGELVFTYQEAMNFGISKKQFCMALDELIEKGFLEITCQGTGPGQPSTYKLTERWQAYGTKDFYPARPRRKNKANNSGWAIYNDRQKQKLGVNNDTSSGVKKNTCSTNTLNNLVAKSTLEKEAGNIVYD
ncbi:MAG: hypothetical protein ISR65_20685 [Bacteriovoracaceae bacterium]|nr:hypothetical protein [Bacteriovoracaceae bacterium]